MSKRDYINLRIEMAEPASAKEKKSDDNYLSDSFLKKNEKDKEVNKNSKEIEKGLEKNLRRLKLERERVI
jgi:DNA-nicking Smr family endonuclease